MIVGIFTFSLRFLKSFEFVFREKQNMLILSNS
jgi:hypothetical protein